MDEFFKQLIAALEPGMKMTITFEKPAADFNKSNVVKCPHCGWKRAYARHDAAVRGWDTHSKSCKAKKDTPVTIPSWLQDQAKGE